MPSVCATAYPSYEIIVADNASTDESVAWLGAHHPEVRIVQFDENFGYCGGNNKAVPYARGDVLLFLNNDVKVTKNWLHPLADIFDQQLSVAAVQPKLRSFRAPSMFEYAGASGGFMDKLGVPYCRGRLFDTVEKDTQQYDNARPIFWASGAALAIRKPIFEELEGFDETFEFHMEEIDLCWRLQRAGHSVWVCPQSTVYHVGGGSLAPESPRKLYYNYRNSLKMLWKNLPPAHLWWLFPLRFLFDYTAAVTEGLSGNFKRAGAILKGHLHFWGQFWGTHAARQRISFPFKLANESSPRILSVAWQYFVNGRKTFNELPDS